MVEEVFYFNGWEINKAGKRNEGYSRTAMKTATWRVIASLDTMLIAWFFTGNLKVAFSVGSFEVITKLVLYFLHERLWNRLPFGIYESRKLNERYKKRVDKKQTKQQKKEQKKKAKSKGWIKLEDLPYSHSIVPGGLEVTS